MVIGTFALAYALVVPRVSHEYTAPMAPASVAPTSASTTQATVLFAGDTMFDRTVRQSADRFGGDYLFACIDQTLKSADLVVINLEGPITATSSVSVGSLPEGIGNFTFTFPTSTAALLAKHGISAVNLGNNHIENFGGGGVRSTMQLLSDAGVRYFGDPLAHTVARENVAGVPLSIIGYNEFLSTSRAAQATLAQVRTEASLGRLPVVYAHWGVEYATSTSASIISLAHRFVDAGAVAVIGSHPHVVQPSETYKGAPIYYSLGNFIFDQYFSSATTHGLLVAVTFSNGHAQGVREIPVEIHRNQVCPSPTN